MLFSCTLCLFPILNFYQKCIPNEKNNMPIGLDNILKLYIKEICGMIVHFKPSHYGLINESHRNIKCETIHKTTLDLTC